MENKELQNLLLHERKSSILNIHKISSLENELIAFKHKLEAEKYESEAQKAINLQLEQQLNLSNDIQNQPQNILMQSTQAQYIQVRFIYYTLYTLYPLYIYFYCEFANLLSMNHCEKALSSQINT